MERNFSNENFERFLRQNSDGLRMRPSDKVWKGISRRLNQRRRRMGFILGLTLLIGSGLGYYLVEQQTFNHPQKTVTEKNNPSSISQKNNPSGPSPSDNTNSVNRSGETDISYSSSRPSLFGRSVSSGFADLSTPAAIGSENILAQNDFSPAIVDSYFSQTHAEETRPLMSQVYQADPLTIESILNSYSSRIRKGKLGFGIYFTPTISYRKLSENKAYLNSLQPGAPPIVNPDFDNINSAVTHKPDFGFEIGVTAKYPVSRKVKLRGGFQFNINRYEIKTYNTSTQLATIRLNNRNGADSLNAVTNYNNFTGYKSNWLENFYFQVSAPVGLELKLKGDERMQFGIATTIQPTYVLGDRVYLISTDYKNYAEVPRLIRRWNVHTNLETYVSYSTGQLKWQVGPQVRYQLLSSFVKKYPVKENLFDFGLKVGVSLNNK